MKKLFTAVRKNDLPIVKAILEKQPGLISCISGSAPKKDAGQSLLQIVLKCGSLDVADYLIDFGSDINFIESEISGNPWRAPVLHDAINAAIMSCRWNTYSPARGLTVFSTEQQANFAYTILEKMLRLGADVNAADSYGNTGIFRACIQASQILPAQNRQTSEFSTDRLFTQELEHDLRQIFSLLQNFGADVSYKRPDLGMTVYEFCPNILISNLLG